MEREEIFVNAESFVSKKQNKTFFMIYTIYRGKVQNNFVSQQVFEDCRSKKLGESLIIKYELNEYNRPEVSEVA